MASTNIITSLGAADLDTKQLVTDLVSAVKEPRQKIVDEAKKKAEVAISSVGLLKSALTSLQTAATELGSLPKLNKLSISNSNSGVVIAQAGGVSAATPGNHSLTVSQLAQPKRMRSAGFATSSTVVTAAAMTLTLTTGIAPATTATTVNIAANTTVAGVVSAINSAGSDVTARLVNTGTGATPYQIVLEGKSGSTNSFTAASSDSAAIDFPTTLQTAQDATFTLNGIPMSRSSNTVTDALDGVTLRLNSVSATPVQLGVNFDGTEIAAAVTRFADAFNLLNEFVNAATGPANEDNELAGTLQNNSSVRTIKTMLRNKLTARSSSASGDITHWSVLGVALDRNGVLQVDEATIKSKFENNPQDVIKALSNNASSPYLFSGSPSGLAGDIAVSVYGMVRTTGTVPDLQKSYEDGKARAEKMQTKLDDDIERLQARYERQFSALNAVLASFKETSKRLDSTFNQKQD
jgi:flagellar hook-associated protein 2